MNPQEFHEIITEVTDYSGNGKHFQYINKFSQEVGFYWFFACPQCPHSIKSKVISLNGPAVSIG